MLVAVYEIYVSVPTKIERAVRDHGHGHEEAIALPAPKSSTKEPRTSWS
jgi:hypothetical protein